MVKHKVSISLDGEVVKAVSSIAKEIHLSFSTTVNQLLWKIIGREKIRDLILKKTRKSKSKDEN